MIQQFWCDPNVLLLLRKSHISCDHSGGSPAQQSLLVPPCSSPFLLGISAGFLYPLYLSSFPLNACCCCICCTPTSPLTGWRTLAPCPQCHPKLSGRPYRSPCQVALRREERRLLLNYQRHLPSLAAAAGKATACCPVALRCWLLHLQRPSYCEAKHGRGVW